MNLLSHHAVPEICYSLPLYSYAIHAANALNVSTQHSPCLRIGQFFFSFSGTNLLLCQRISPDLGQCSIEPPLGFCQLPLSLAGDDGDFVQSADSKLASTSADCVNWGLL